MSANTADVVLVGAGKMGQALIRGWLAQGLAPHAITALDPDPSAELTSLAAESGIKLNPAQPPRHVDALVLAVKPQIYAQAAGALKHLIGPSTLIISIMAGKTINAIANALGPHPEAPAIVRAMPNTPAAIGRGIAGLCANSATSAPQKQLAEKLLRATGQALWVDTEDMIDAVTALSGSGPAYVFYLVEALAASGERLGLDPKLAMTLARATVEGSGALLASATHVSAAQLRINVTSPGGTTAAALEVLMAEDGLQPLLDRALEAARARAQALAD
jgi:pyrroline-5-carboxylate reductase